MKTACTLALGIAIGASIVWYANHRVLPEARAVTADRSPSQPVVLAAAQGRVEGRGELIGVEAATDGVIKTLLVKEGQRVGKDQIIATIGCEQLEFELRALEAAVESARQARARLLRGSREEERRVAEQDVRAAEAVADQAKRQSDRMSGLAAKDNVPLTAAENAKRDADAAHAALNAALERQKLVNAGPLPEEILKADADVSTAEERVRGVAAQNAKCSVRSPIDGTVTRVHLRSGEAFSTFTPRPIVTVADLSGRRVRAEVDERDLPKIQIGQKARITAAGFPQPFFGKVGSTAVAMGRKTARSMDPSEHSDRDIMETLISLDAGVPKLPIGLRVVVEFLQK